MASYLLSLFDRIFSDDGIESVQLHLLLGRILGIPIPSLKMIEFRKYLFYLYCFLIILIVVFGYIALEIWDAINSMHSLDAATQNICLTFTHVAGLIKILNLIWRSGKLLQTLDLLKYMQVTFAVSKEQKNVLIRMDKYIKAVFISFAILVTLTAIIGILSLAIDPSIGGTKFPFRAHIPPTIIPKQFHILIFSVGVTWNAWLIVVHDCFIMALMNHICAQLMVLKYALKNIQQIKLSARKTDDRHEIDGGDESDNNAGEQLACVQLKFCVQHHQLIVRLRNEIETIFTGVLLIQFLTSMIIFGLTGFQATVRSERSGSDFTLYAYCLCLISELFIYCWFANQVLDQSGSLSLSGYTNTWYTFGKKFNTILLILMTNAKRPLVLTGGGFFQLSLDTFSSILTKSYSYVALLRQIYYGDKI